MKTKETIKKTLISLLEKHPADSLTVKLACMEAGISKQTLYNHYYSLMDALEDAYENEFSRTMQHCNTYSDWVVGFRTFLEFLLDRKKFVLHVYFSSHQTEFIEMMRKHGAKLIKQGIRDVGRDIDVEVSERDIEFMLRFYMYIFMGIVEDFIRDRMRQDPNYIASRCDAMMRYHIRHSLRNIHDMDKGLIF